MQMIHLPKRFLPLISCGLSARSAPLRGGTSERYVEAYVARFGNCGSLAALRRSPEPWWRMGIYAGLMGFNWISWDFFWSSITMYHHFCSFLSSIIMKMENEYNYVVPSIIGCHEYVPTSAKYWRYPMEPWGFFGGLNVIDPIHAWWCLSKSLVSFPYWLRKIVVTRYNLSIGYEVVKEGTHQEYCFQIQTDEFLLFLTLLTPKHHISGLLKTGSLFMESLWSKTHRSPKESQNQMNPYIVINGSQTHLGSLRIIAWQFNSGWSISIDHKLDD